MRNQTKKRFISLLLVLCMLVSLLAVLPIQSFAAISTSDNHFFKVGATSALANGTRKAPIDEPFEYGGTVYIPVSSLTAALGSAPAGGTVTVNGTQAVALANIGTAYSGYYGSISNMGLIAVSKTQNLLSSTNYDDDLDELELMKKFLFDNIGTDGTTNNNSFGVEDMKSTDHPYIYANQSKFDELAAVYAAGQAGEAVDQTLYSYINNRVTYAKRLYDQYAQIDADGNYTAMNTQVNLVRGHQDYIFEIPYQTTGSTGGYDVGGRLADSVYNNNRILDLAYAYQITKDMNYAKLAYQYAIYMGQWEHWGPGHFLNAADAMSPYAIAYDWLYDAWAQLQSEGATYLYFNGTYTSNVPQFDTKTVSVAAIEQIIFTHGIVPAYYSINSCSTKAGSAPWISTTVGTGGYNYNRVNNWNAVCSAGTTLAALALVGSTTATADVLIDTTVDGIYNPTVDYASYLSYEDSGCDSSSYTITEYSTYQEYSAYVINQNLYNLPLNGLAQYISDGSYIESNSYWVYGTNNLYEMAAALTSTTGSHYGLLDAWGMDTTVYYALNTMSSDGLSFNYHDSNGTSPLDTSWYMYLGHEEALGDKALAGIRKDLNANIKQDPSIYDAIFYMSDEEIGSFEYPELQYWMAGIDGYAVRDSWDPEVGTLYGAFLGEGNNIDHGQVDSGSFVYYNKGTTWFCDLGTEEYNAYNFWSQPYRARYYAMGPEGNNTLIIKGQESDTFFGQSLDGSGELTKQGNNGYGAYAVIDNTSVYDSFATSALRGMLLTNDRKTFVIQDQVTFSSAQSVAWIAHTLASVEIMLSIDGTVAYMSDGENVIKVTIIDPDNAGLTFRVANASEHLLENTSEYDYSTSNGGVQQKDYSSYQKLLIEAEGVTSFNVAVVIEEVVPGETKNDAEGVGYSWTDMNSWSSTTPTDDNRGDDTTSGGDGEQTVVGTVTVTEKTDSGDDGDSPIVDLWGSWGSVEATSDSSETVGEPVTYTAYSFEELANYINSHSNHVITVDLKASNDTPISITNPCTVTLNGNELLATSDKYVANLDGDTVEYKSGSITVTWMLTNGSKVTEVYTGSTVASYKGSITEGTTIYEVDNGDGTYSYYTSGNAWALTEGGKQVTGNALIVTSENNTFYQTGKEFDGLFVTVSGATVKGYYTANDFFSSAVFGTKYDRISITEDFGYDATAKSDVHSFSHAANLYLNGNTLTFTSSDTSDHMFIANGGDLNVYGPGGINSQAESSNMFYNDVTAGDNIYVENADLYSVRAIIDLRCNTATFKNCNVTIEKEASAFGVINRNNAAAVNPTLVVDGCTVTMLVTPNATSSGNGVVSLMANSTAELTGGTTIVTPADCSLFILKNSTVGTVDGYDYANGYNEMYAIIGEVYHSLSTISTSLTNDSSGTTYDMSGRVFWGEGYTSETDPSSLNIMSGLVVAKMDENTYVIADPANCATVVWKSGTTTLDTEYWLAGTTPQASSDIKNGVTVDSGKMLTFATDVVAAGASVTYTAVVIDSFGLKVNMSLQADFNLNFYVENIGTMTFLIDGVEVTPDTEAMSGYYKVSKTNINPSMAGKSVKLEIVYNGNTVTTNISPMDYVRRVLADSEQSGSHAMMVNIIKYSEAAYVYAGNNINEYAADYSRVFALYNEYKTLATVAVVDRQPVSMSAVTDAIGSAQLNLLESPRFRFNLKSTYTGTVTINGTEYKVENGMYGKNSYIEIAFKAYDLLADISIVTANGSATYSLANYYYYEAVEHGPLSELLNALYAYCETAKIYNDSQSA